MSHFAINDNSASRVISESYCVPAAGKNVNPDIHIEDPYLGQRLICYSWGQEVVRTISALGLANEPLSAAFNYDS